MFQFVVTPFLPSHQPALGVSSIVSVLREAGFNAHVSYLNLELCRQIGWEASRFVEINFSKDLLLGDLLFAPALWDAWPTWSAVEERLLSRLKSNYVMEEDGTSRSAVLGSLQWLYNESSNIVDGWAAMILDKQARVVGFTSTFQQNVASLALAKRISEKGGDIRPYILFGGANCDGDMGVALSESFPFIDCVVSGEAEKVIVPLAERLCGPHEQGNERLPRVIRGEMVTELDELPIPSFDDYFNAMSTTDWYQKANLVAESSRGCWWGMRSHCTFCGLNGTTMAYRSKSSGRFEQELDTLSANWGMSQFMLTDNIMDLSYLKTLLPSITGRSKSFELVYETKANLSREALEIMAAAGVFHIQPGIESFSTPVLKLMGKGTSRLQNIQLLKWCEEYGIGVSWGIIYGFPGEDVGEYNELSDLIPTLVHLHAPAGIWSMRLDRFSPYWKEPERYGIINVRPTTGYRIAYPELSEDQRRRIAYFFDYDYEDGRNPQDYVKDTETQVLCWKAARARGAKLELRVLDEYSAVYDSRMDTHGTTTRLSGDEEALIRILDRRIPKFRAVERFKSVRPFLDGKQVEQIFSNFEARQWTVSDETGSLVSVVVDPTQSRRVTERIVQEKLRRFGLCLGNEV